MSKSVNHPTKTLSRLWNNWGLLPRLRLSRRACATSLGLAALLGGCGEYVPPEAHNGWVWTEPVGMKCRDGSETGYGYNKSPSGSTQTLFMLQGGGACFNPLTCLENLEHFDRETFVNRSAGGTDATADDLSMNAGTLDRTAADNPFKDWNYVWIPYCTGDVFMGAEPSGIVPGWVEGPQMFVGWENLSIAVPDAMSTLGPQSRVVFGGFSAGGFGAAGNGKRVAEMLSPIPVDILDDSGPPMTHAHVSPCLQTQMWDLWNLEATLGATCPSCSADHFVMPLGLELVADAAARGRSVGVMASWADETMRAFFGFSKNECSVTIPEMAPDLYKSGLKEGTELLALEAEKAGSARAFQSFVFTGNAHTNLHTVDFYSRETNGVSLVDWTRDFLSGNPTHVWPAE